MTSPITPELRPDYLATRATRTLPAFRAGLLLASFLLASFAIWDELIAPGSARLTLPIRIVPAMLGLLMVGLSFRPALRRYLFAGLEIFVCVAIAALAMVLTLLPEGFLYGLTGLFVVPMVVPAFAPTVASVMRVLLWLILVTQVGLFAQPLPAKVILNAESTLLLVCGFSGMLGFLSVLARQREFRLERSLYQQAITDSLTGLFNRRHFLDRAASDIRRAQRHGRPLAAMLLDIDHFKQVNDRFGHDVGDMVIQATARTLKQQLRDGDVIARVGGEEFAVLLPDTPADQLLTLAERLRAAIADSPLEAQDAVCWTVSIGCAVLTPDISRIEALLKLCDQRLYHAKQLGRDRVVFG